MDIAAAHKRTSSGPPRTPTHSAYCDADSPAPFGKEASCWSTLLHTTDAAGGLLTPKRDSEGPAEGFGQSDRGDFEAVEAPAVLGAARAVAVEVGRDGLCLVVDDEDGDVVGPYRGDLAVDLDDEVALPGADPLAARPPRGGIAD